MYTIVRNFKSLIIAGVLAFALSILAIPMITSAQSVPNPARTEVTGYITENTTPVSGASVSVVCNSNTQSTASDTDGSYLVSFLASNCPLGSQITVSAVKDSMSGTSTGNASKITTKLNVAVIDVAVPEIGTIAAISSLTVAGGAIVYSRRRQMQS